MMLRKVVAAFALAASLSGCNVAFPLLPSGQEPAATMSLFGGAVAVGGPAGYCVDTATSRPRQGLAIMAGCGVLRGEGAVPFPNAVIVVQAGAAGSASVAGSEQALQALLQSPDGAALLSFAGDGTTIEVREAASAANAVTIAFTDTGDIPIPGLQQAEWRGFMDIGDRMITVGLRGLAEDPLPLSLGTDLLQDVMTAIMALNPGGDDPL